jgi:hypothetical protein
MWRRLLVLIVLIVGTGTVIAALQEINLPVDTSHPEQDARRAVRNNDFGFIGVYSYAFTIPDIEGVYRYHQFSKNLYSQLKVVRGTSDVRRADGNDINGKALAYANRYNRVLLDWIEGHHRDWLGPREPLTR